MTFRVLGPLRIELNGSPVELSVRMQRRLLAALLSRAGEPVASSALADALWPRQRPANWNKTVQIYVSRLRKQLGDTAPIVRRESGYALLVGPGQLDAAEFGGLVERARQSRAAGELVAASELVDQALGLWRGSPYQDLEHCQFIEPEVIRLQALRLEALEERNAAELERGRHLELIPELSALAAEHPLEERLHHQLMLALYRAGRQADALDAYQRARRNLAAELGVEPTQDLRELHVAILRRDPALDLVPPMTAAPSVPSELPADLATFTGRTGELAEIITAAPGVAQVVAIVGMAGIGKTALAVRSAHRMADRFPDGRLFLDLHGFTEGVSPVDPALALDRLLRKIGVPGEQIPLGMAEKTKLWRSRLAGRRVLVLLDDARDEAQVRPLLPGTPACVVLITSRRRLTGLDDVRLMELDTLSHVDARNLLTQVAGPDRMRSEPEAVDELVTLCGGLPLALRLVSARLRDRPAWQAGDLVERLRDEHDRLAEIELAERSVAGAFELSYRPLGSQQQRLFRLLGLQPGTEFDVDAAAALADASPVLVAGWLAELADSHLVQPWDSGRYAFHDLLRTYAVIAVAREESDADRRTAFNRLLDWYLERASQAMEVYESPALDADHKKSTAWLDTERANLIAMAGRAIDGWPSYVPRLSRSLGPYLRNAAHYTEATLLYRHALQAARADADRPAEARALNELGQIYVRLGKNADALHAYEAALAIARQDQLTAELPGILTSLALALIHLGRVSDALDVGGEALSLHRQNGDEMGELSTLRALGMAHHYLSRFEVAVRHYEGALALSRKLADRRQEANSLTGLGSTSLLMGRPAVALKRHREAHALYEELGHRAEESLALIGIGNALRVLGELPEALEHHRRALWIAEQIESRNQELESRFALGLTLRAVDQVGEACEQLRIALALAEELGQELDEAHLHDALAQTSELLGELEAARRHRRRALEISDRLGTPDVRSVEQHLTSDV